MAHCGKCGKNVGCGCNLTNGKCANCIAKEIQEEAAKKQEQPKAKQESE